MPVIASRQASAAACGGTTGPLITSGGQLEAGGHPWVPYGVTVSGLEHPLGRYARDPAAGTWKRYVASDLAQIQAARDAWCSNVIRIQVDQQEVIHRNADFMADLKKEVDKAESLNMAVAINDQSEWDSRGYPDNYQSSMTGSFWREITAVGYGKDDRIIFDLFNEPGMNWSWSAWHDRTRAVVNEIRDNGANNMIWAEGPQGAQTLEGVGSHRVADSNIVYEIHHPYPPRDAASWERDYYGSSAPGSYPVIDGEWTNWSAARGECWPDAPTAVPKYLSWLTRHHIGMTVWDLGWDGSPGAYGSNYVGPAVLSVGSYGTPVSFHKNWACTDGLNQGAGRQIMDWYHAQNTGS